MFDFPFAILNGTLTNCCCNIYAYIFNKQTISVCENFLSSDLHLFGNNISQNFILIFTFHWSIIFCSINKQKRTQMTIIPITQKTFWNMSMNWFGSNYLPVLFPLHFSYQSDSNLEYRWSVLDGSEQILYRC